MRGFFCRRAAVTVALLVVAGLTAPSVTMAQQDATKSAPPTLVPPANTQAAQPAPAATPAPAPHPRSRQQRRVLHARPLKIRMASKRSGGPAIGYRRAHC